MYGLPQALTGSEMMDIQQSQNGNWAQCSVPLDTLKTFLSIDFSTLPTVLPSQSGLLWNNGGMICIS